MRAEARPSGHEPSTEQIAQGLLRHRQREHGRSDRAGVGGARLRRARARARSCSAARAASTPARSRDAARDPHASCFTRSPACCRPTAWGSRRVAGMRQADAGARPPVRSELLRRARSGALSSSTPQGTCRGSTPDGVGEQQTQLRQSLDLALPGHRDRADAGAGPRPSFCSGASKPTHRAAVRLPAATTSDRGHAGAGGGRARSATRLAAPPVAASDAGPTALPSHAAHRSGVGHAGIRTERAAVYRRAELAAGTRASGSRRGARGDRHASWSTRAFVLRARAERPAGVDSSGRRSQAAAPRRTRACADRDTPDPVQLELWATASCRSPSRWGTCCGARRSAPTSASASTSRAPCSIATAAWSPTRRTSPCTSARWASRCAPCSHGSPRRPTPGDVFVTNDPARGGSHLPDITVVTAGARRRRPARVLRRQPRTPRRRRRHDARARCRRSRRGSRRRAWCFARNDRAGGRASTTRVRAGGARQRPYPARAPARQPRGPGGADRRQPTRRELLAALHARARRRRRRSATWAHPGRRRKRSVVHAASRACRGQPRCSRRAGRRHADRRSRSRVRDGRLRVDFTRHRRPSIAGNLNAPRAVTLAAVLYVLRALVARSHPAQQRLPARRRAASFPKPSLLVARRGPRGGRRQRRDLAARRRRAARRARAPAASQGTMNNLTFGNASFGYYETIAGGAGAGRASRAPPACTRT